MKFSLINVIAEDGDKVSGYWVQDHVGTIDSANQLLLDSNAVNGNKLNLAIVDALNSCIPLLGYWSNLRRVYNIK